MSDQAERDHIEYLHRHPKQPGERDVHAYAADGMAHTEGDEL